MYKLIAFDLDGTLLTEEKTITEETLDVIYQLIKKDCKIVIVTGRAYISAKNLTSSIRNDLVYICNNGNVVRNSKDDSLIMENSLDKNDAKLVLEEGYKMDFTPIIHVNKFEENYDAIVLKENEYFDENKPVPNKSGLRIKYLDEFTDNDLESILSLAYFGEERKTRKIYNTIERLYPNKFESHLMENIVTADSLAEFMPLGGNKWETLYKYARSEGIKREEIVAFGDDNNDIEMLEKSGLGVAMVNGSEKTKNVADLVTKYNNDESGVAIQLKEIFDLD